MVKGLSLMGLVGATDLERRSLVRLRLITHNARLVDARKERGMTQPDLAIAIKIPLCRMHAIENLKVIPSEDDMIRIACFLVKPIDDLFPEELMSAIRAGVFSRRKVELDTPEISLTEAQHLKELTYDGETKLIDEISRAMLPEKINEVLETLALREKKVLKLRFGLRDGRSQTLEEVAKEFNVTREWIRQIEAKALRKLRHPTNSRKLKDFLQY